MSEALRQYVLKLVDTAANKIGWEFGANDDFLTGQLRALLITTAGMAGHEGVIAEAKKRFAAFKDGDKKAIHPSLRLPTFKIAVKEGGRDAYNVVMNEYLHTTSVDGKEIALQALGRVQDKQLAKEYLDWSFSGAVATQDLHTPSRAVALNSKIRPVVWEFVQNNWDMLRDRLGGNMVVLERYVRMSLNKFSSFQVEEEIENFFKNKDNTGYDRGLAVVSDTIKGAARYKENDLELIREWLSAHGYSK